MRVDRMSRQLFHIFVHINICRTFYQHCLFNIDYPVKTLIFIMKLDIMQIFQFIRHLLLLAVRMYRCYPPGKRTYACKKEKNKQTVKILISANSHKNESSYFFCLPEVCISSFIFCLYLLPKTFFLYQTQIID